MFDWIVTFYQKNFWAYPEQYNETIGFVPVGIEYYEHKTVDMDSI